MSTSQQIIDDAPFSWPDLGRAMWYFLADQKTVYVGWSLVLILCQAYQLIPAFIVGKIVDFFLHYHSGDSLMLFYGYVLILGISSAVVAYVRLTSKNQLSRIDVDVLYRTKVEAFERLMDFSIAWHQSENTGNKVQKIQNGVTNLRAVMRTLRSDAPSYLINLVGVTLIFLFLDWRFFILFAVYTASFIGIEWRFYRRINEANTAFNKAQEASSGTYFESASNVLTIKTLGLKDSMTESVSRSEDLARKHSNHIRLLYNHKWKIFQAVNAVALVAFLLLIGQEVLVGLVSVGAIVTYWSYFNRLTNSSGDALETFVGTIESKSAIGRMMPIFWDRPLPGGSQVVPANWESIVIGGASFGYPNAEGFQLHDLNLEIQRGQHIGIVGHSGSGKSTLAKLLLGIYPLQQGEISIGGRNLVDIDHRSLTHHVSTVLQETELFNLSLKENLTLTKNVSRAVLNQAILISQLQPVIDQLPQGLDTLIGEKGYKLSGGERQRIGIARAICSGAEVLVLDEATSALDSKTESLIQEGLLSQLRDKTLIIIAHRLSTLKQVDQIVVFDHGQIIERGSFDELARQPESHFGTLWRLQQRAAGDTM